MMRHRRTTAGLPTLCADEGLKKRPEAGSGLQYLPAHFARQNSVSYERVRCPRFARHREPEDQKKPRPAGSGSRLLSGLAQDNQKLTFTRA